MAITLQDLTKGDGYQGTPGLKLRHRFAFESDIATLPAPLSNPTTFAQAITVEDNVVFKTGKKWWKMEGVLDRSMFEGKGSEQLGSAGVDNLVTIFLANNEANLGFLQTHRNTNFIMCIEDARGRFRLLGQENMPANIVSFNEKSGAAQGDDSIIEVKISNPGKLAPFYTGTFQDVPMP